MSLHFKTLYLRIVSVLTQRAPLTWHSDYCFLARRPKFILYSLAVSHSYVDRPSEKDTPTLTCDGEEILNRVRVRSSRQPPLFEALHEHSLQSPGPGTLDVAVRYVFQIVWGSDREDWLISEECDRLMRLVNGLERERRILTASGQKLVREILEATGV